MEKTPHLLQEGSAENGQGTTILVFATTIQLPSDISRIKPLLDHHEAILTWNVDLEDWEKILRIKGNGITGDDISQMISATGIEIRELK